MTDTRGKGEPNAQAENVQDLTNYIQTLLQQMQDRFQSTSDQIIGRSNIFMDTLGKTLLFLAEACLVMEKNGDKHQMGQRIDDLEKNIADLMTQAGVDEK